MRSALRHPSPRGRSRCQRSRHNRRGIKSLLQSGRSFSPRRALFSRRVPGCLTVETLFTQKMPVSRRTSAQGSSLSRSGRALQLRGCVRARGLSPPPPLGLNQRLSTLALAAFSGPQLPFRFERCNISSWGSIITQHGGKHLTEAFTVLLRPRLAAAHWAFLAYTRSRSARWSPTSGPIRRCDGMQSMLPGQPVDSQAFARCSCSLHGWQEPSNATLCRVCALADPACF